METPHPSSSSGGSPTDRLSTSGLRVTLAGSAHFWEPCRLVYNLVLTTVALIWLVATWPHFRPMLIPSSLVLLAVLALLANVCYCAVYLVDIPLQHSGLRAMWSSRRWILWLLGTLFAILLENYWIADEIYSYVH
jgi:predicted neutral ceramidase superfamily lipid hydrolase